MAGGFARQVLRLGCKDLLFYTKLLVLDAYNIEL